MLKYRVVLKGTASENGVEFDLMDQEEAFQCMMSFRDLYPENTYDIKEYNWSHDGHRLGRDPDLH